MSLTKLGWKTARAALMLALFISTSAAAQKKVTISGHITDIASGETLIGAGILEKELCKGNGL